MSFATVCNATEFPDGVLPGEFSVSPTKKVHFSQGNLQYQASTNTWRFAEQQYDMIGEANKNISSTYSGWIDLFGWGTSGWNSGAKAYQPYSINKDDNDYIQCAEMTGEYANADWGVYNKIINGGNQAGMWRTLTKKEWAYLLKERPNANKLYEWAVVNYKLGLVIYPDNWTGVPKESGK